MADRIISLGIGDTTQPIPDHILNGLVESATKLGTKEGYSGYGAEQGMGDLRAKIADKLYNGIIKDSEVFVSDGATSLWARCYHCCSGELVRILYGVFFVYCQHLCTSHCIILICSFNFIQYRILPTLYMS